jgi:hypothetical protein
VIAFAMQTELTFIPGKTETLFKERLFVLAGYKPTTAKGS